MVFLLVKKQKIHHSLFGRQGNDSLDGGEGDDIVLVGKGSNTCWATMVMITLMRVSAAIGKDRFVLQLTASSDTLTDLTDREDLIVLAIKITFK